MTIFNTYEHIITAPGAKSLQEHWNETTAYKEKFLEYTDQEALAKINLNPNILNSWIKSRANGIDPHTIHNRRIWQLSEKEINRIIADNQLLINITKSMIHTLQLRELEVSTEYSFYLIDKNGVMLMQLGDKLLIDDDSMVGSVWNESTLGTCAHVISMQLKQPAHLVGPEHYSDIFQNSSVLAAPIMDENNDILAEIVLSQHFVNPTLDTSFIKNSMYAQGLIIGMAIAIENKLKLHKSYAELKKVNEELEKKHAADIVTLNEIDGSLVMVDKDGLIVNFNAEASRVLHLDKHESGKKNINDFLSNNSHIATLMEQGGNADDFEESIVINGEEKVFYVMVRPILKESKLLGSVIRFNNMDKINDLVTRRAGATARYNYEDIIGESKAFKEAIELGKRFSRSNENVLLIGESGTGKELFAQSLHNQYRPQGPFMAVNCAAMPRELIESELFGYEGGSFTGAERTGKPGKIELANGGTLFLDEIGDMPFELQSVLLRVLEDKQIMRIGGRRYKKVDFRLIAATNKNLQKMMEENLFREDLYYRLSVLSIHLPPLRDRGNDVELLCQYFVERYCRKLGLKTMRISPAALKRINEYRWPGNVRQLENAMIYAVNHAENEEIRINDLPATVLEDNSPPINTVSGEQINEIRTIEAMEKVVIENALFKTRNNISRAAEFLGIGKSTLYRKLKEYNISVE